MDSRDWMLYTEIEILQEKKRKLTLEIQGIDELLRDKTNQLYKNFREETSKIRKYAR